MSKKIEEVVVIGGGLMGAGIAQVRSDMPNFGLIQHWLGFFYVQFTSSYSIISDFKACFQAKANHLSKHDLWTWHTSKYERILVFPNRILVARIRIFD